MKLVESKTGLKLLDLAVEYTSKDLTKVKEESTPTKLMFQLMKQMAPQNSKKFRIRALKLIYT